MALLAAIVAQAGCGAAPSSPSPAGPLRLTVEPLQTLAGSPSTAEFALKLQNTGTAPALLSFPSSCQVMPYIVDRATSRVVAPEGGSWVCAAIVTNLTLGPGETHIETAHIAAARAGAGAFIDVPPGDYAIYARLEDATVKLQSAAVPFSVR